METTGDSGLPTIKESHLGIEVQKKLKNISKVYYKYQDKLCPDLEDPKKDPILPHTLGQLEIHFYNGEYEPDPRIRPIDHHQRQEFNTRGRNIAHLIDSLLPEEFEAIPEQDEKALETLTSPEQVKAFWILDMIVNPNFQQWLLTVDQSTYSQFISDVENRTIPDVFLTNEEHKKTRLNTKYKEKDKVFETNIPTPSGQNMVQIHSNRSMRDTFVDLYLDAPDLPLSKAYNTLVDADKYFQESQ